MTALKGRDTAIYLLSLLAHDFEIVIDQEVVAPCHAKGLLMD